MNPRRVFPVPQWQQIWTYCGGLLVSTMPVSCQHGVLQQSFTSSPK